MPSTSWLTSTAVGASVCRRENASRRWVREAAREAPERAISR